MRYRSRLLPQTDPAPQTRADFNERWRRTPGQTGLDLVHGEEPRQACLVEIHCRLDASGLSASDEDDQDEDHERTPPIVTVMEPRSRDTSQHRTDTPTAPPVLGS